MLKFLIKIIIVILCISFSEFSYAQKNPVRIYFPTNISGGNLSPSDIIEMAKKDGINNVILIDHYIRRYEYGIKPLRNIIKRRTDKDSIVKMGIDKYINLYKEINREFSDIKIIPSLHISPFYYWDNKILNGNDRGLFIFGEFSKFGLKDIKNIPNLGNNPPREYNIKRIIGLWPIALIVWIVFLYPKRKKLVIILFIIGSIVLINNFPFSSNIYDQYHGDKKIIPYKYLIDYVNKMDAEILKKSSIFWNTYKLDYFYLINTAGYTGISVDKDNSFIGINNIWDKLLNDYIYGKRDKPVYIIGVNSWDNILLSDKDTILNSLKNGNLYIEKRTDILNNFSIDDSATGTIGNIGGFYNFKGNAKIRIELNIPDRDILIKVIRNGKPIKDIDIKKGEGAMGFSYIDDYIKKNNRVYYRLIFYHKDDIILATNPIFIRFL